MVRNARGFGGGAKGLAATEVVLSAGFRRREFGRSGRPSLQRVSENADEAPVTFVLAQSLLALALAGIPPVATGADAAHASAGLSPRRLVARFNFEESADFNPGVPVNFYRVTSELPDAKPGDAKAPVQNETDRVRDSRALAPGLPPFGDVTLAQGVGRMASTGGATGGKGYAVRFDVVGASMVLGRDIPLDGVSPGADLVLRAWARTEGLRYASVRISARYFDADGRVIPGIFASELVRAETDWRMLEVKPPATPANARLMQLWLEVVQPAPQTNEEHARFEVARSDVSGRAYFDDIELWQLPSVKFEPDALGIVSPSGRAKLRLRCDDPIVRSTDVQVRVRDAGNNTVFEQRLEVPADRELTLEMPQLATGWYEAEARYSHGKSEIARRLARFAVLPDDPFEPDQPPRFGASLCSLDVPIDPAVDLARSSFVVLPVWNENTELRESEGEIELLRPLVGRLLDRRVEPMFRLRAVPARLANTVRIESADALGLFALDEARWRPALEPWLLAFGQRVDQWFIGSDPVDADRPDLAARVDDIARAMGKSIAGPVVSLPWRPEERVPAALQQTVERGHHTIEVVADAAWRESGAEAYEGLPTGPRGMARIVPLPAGSVDDRERAIDLALRAIDAWRAGFDAVSIEVRADGVPPVPGPALEFAAWRQISTRLCGRRFVAEIPVGDGMRAMLADGARGTVLVMWDEQGGGANTPARVIDIALGQQPVLATDLWGRTQRLAPTAKGHTLRVGREPVFIEGVSREMCMLRKSFHVDPMFAESRRAPQDGTLVIANPWEKTLSGTLTVLGPDALEISPRTHRFNIPPGGEARMPVAFSVPRSTEAGTVPVRVEVAATADEPFRATFESPIEIGYRKAVVQPSWRLARSIESGAIDLVLTLKVTNISASPIDVEAFAGAEGYSSDRKLVTGLAPGAMAVRAFVFADGARKLSGRDIRTGVHDADGDARLLKRVSVPPLLPPIPSVAAVDDGRNR